MHLAAIYRHPVKSLGSEPLERTILRAGEALPGDRAHALTHGDSAFDPEKPGWTPCGSFLRIANIPALARPAVSYDPDSRVLTLTDGGVRADHDLSTREGRAALAAWAGEAAGSVRPGPYDVVEAPGVAMTDSSAPFPSLMSLASLRDLSARSARRSTRAGSAATCGSTATTSHPGPNSTGRGARRPSARRGSRRSSRSSAASPRRRTPGRACAATTRSPRSGRWATTRSSACSSA